MRKEFAAVAAAFLVTSGMSWGSLLVEESVWPDRESADSWGEMTLGGKVQPGATSQSGRLPQEKGEESVPLDQADRMKSTKTSIELTENGFWEEATSVVKEKESLIETTEWLRLSESQWEDVFDTYDRLVNLVANVIDLHTFTEGLTEEETRLAQMCIHDDNYLWKDQKNRVIDAIEKLEKLLDQRENSGKCQ